MYSLGMASTQYFQSASKDAAVRRALEALNADPYIDPKPTADELSALWLDRAMERRSPTSRYQALVRMWIAGTE